MKSGTAKHCGGTSSKPRGKSCRKIPVEIYIVIIMPGVMSYNIVFRSCRDGILNTVRELSVGSGRVVSSKMSNLCDIRYYYLVSRGPTEEINIRFTMVVWRAGYSAGAEHRQKCKTLFTGL